MGLRSRLRRLQKATRRYTIAVQLEDGTEARFYADELFPECFLHEAARGRRHYFGEDPGPAHPFVEALRNAADGEVERLVRDQGTIISLWVGEDQIIRGERERPGPPVTETSPGVYE